jgi:hypothetical protein
MDLKVAPSASMNRGSSKKKVWVLLCDDSDKMRHILQSSGAKFERWKTESRQFYHLLFVTGSTCIALVDIQYIDALDIGVYMDIQAIVSLFTDDTARTMVPTSFTQGEPSTPREVAAGELTHVYIIENLSLDQSKGYRFQNPLRILLKQTMGESLSINTAHIDSKSLSLHEFSGIEFLVHLGKNMCDLAIPLHVTCDYTKVHQIFKALFDLMVQAIGEDESTPVFDSKDK